MPKPGRCSIHYAMGGQPDGMNVHERFDQLIHAFDHFRMSELPFLFPLTGELLATHQSKGASTWLDLYELPVPDLFQKLSLDFLAVFEVKLDPDGKRIIAPSKEWFDSFQSIMKLDQHRILSGFIAFKFLPVLLSARCLLIMAVSQFHFKMSVQSLLKKARAEDLESMMRLVKLDKTFLYSDFVKTSLHEAELSQDKGYFSLLAKVVAPDPNFWSLRGKRNYLGLFTLYNLDDYSRRTDAAWSEFLAAHGFPNFATADSVRKARRRYGLQKPKANE